MGIRVRIPTPLRSVTGGQAEVTGEGVTVVEVLRDLERQFPGLAARIFTEDGTVSRYINIYVNDEDIRFQEGQATPVRDGDEVSIIPAIAGGAR